jgi:predicted ArsR family transcriptional regulator
MSGTDEIASAVRNAEVDLDRDSFLRSLLRELAGALEDVIGLDEAEGFISVFGQRVGEQIDAGYRTALQVDRLSRAQVAQVLVDFKRRIQGDFYVVEESAERIVLGNRRCPFGSSVLGRPAICMMTSSMFGVIAAENLGYARVELQETIAQGHDGCRVVIHLRPTDGPADQGRKYYRA